MAQLGFDVAMIAVYFTVHCNFHVEWCYSTLSCYQSEEIKILNNLCSENQTQNYIFTVTHCHCTTIASIIFSYLLLRTS